MTTTNSTQLNINNGTELTPPSSSLSINFDGFILGGDLNTATPITATISQNGIITDNPNGFNILSPLNMNLNAITNTSGITTSGSNIDIIAQTDDINIQSTTAMSLVVNNGALNLTATGAGITLFTDQQIDLTADAEMNFITPNGIWISATLPNIGDGDVYANFYGNLTGIATNAQNIAITDNNTSATYYPTFVSNNTGNLPLNVDKTTNPLSYIPSTGNLSATTFTGALSGLATNATNAVNCSTSLTTTNANYYPTFVSSNITGNYPNLVGTMTYNPSTNTLTANTFNGALSGTATNSTNSAITDDNTNATFYPVFVSNNTGNLPLKVDKTTNPFSYNPSTGNLSATSYTITGTPSTASVASTFGQVGLVYIGAVQVAITGSASSQNLSFANLFNSTYKNYRITLTPTTQVSFTSTYPSYSLYGFLGTGVPTTGGLFGFEMTSNSTALVSPVYTASGTTLSTTPLVFAVSSIANKQIQFDILNVGFANTTSQIVQLNCKSIYSNPGIIGASDRTIFCTSSSGATITGLIIQQPSIGVGNNMTLEATIYGYNTI